MSAVVVDTHALVWYVEGSPKLSANAKQALLASVQQAQPLRFSAVSLVEILYLCEKGRLSAGLFDRITALLRQSNSDLAAVAFDAAIAETMKQIPSAVLGDMPDRMIAATAIHLGLPLVTKDNKIQSASLATIW